MKNEYRILDFRNRPPLQPYAALFELKRKLLGNPLKRSILELWFRWLTKRLAPYRNRGAATLTASMKMVGEPGAMIQWWREIDAAGIDSVCANGRITEDRGNIDAETLADLEHRYPLRFYGLAPVNLEQDVAVTVSECERALRDLGLRGVNIEPGIRKRGGPAQIDNPDLYPIYEAMVARDAPVMAYTSAFAGPTPYFANRMAPYRRALRLFPKLKLILGHGGYPCVTEVLEAAAQHKNLYICPDVYTFWPGGHLYQREIDRLQDQFVFGTSYPFSSMADAVDETLRMPLSMEAMRKYLYGNGAMLLKL